METLRNIDLAKYVIDKLYYKIEWEDIVEPDINDVALFSQVSLSTIKSHLRNYNCPLIQTNKGNKGRGKTKRFLKESVEQYKL